MLFDQEIRVEIFFDKLSERKNKWLCIGVMYNHETGEKVASWKSLHGMMNRKTRKIEVLTDTAVELIKQYYDAT